MPLHRIPLFSLPRWIGRRVVTAAAMALVLIWSAIAVSQDGPPTKPGNAAGDGDAPKKKPGLQLNDPRAYQGYTLIAPMNGKSTYLIDMQGRVVRNWESQYTAGQDAYFLESGHLLRAATLDSKERTFGGAGQGGRVQEFDWDGNLLWDFKFHDEKRVAHHDICRLPNGNVLLIVWEIKTPDEAAAAGRKPDSVRGAWLADSLVEIKPTGKTTGDVVWEWHIWDHLVQDADPSKANYGDVAKHPELIDVNFGVGEMGFGGFPGGPPRKDMAKKDARKAEVNKKKELDRLKAIGYVGTAAAPGNRGMLPDWTHVNSVAYHAGFDQIMISVRSFGEFWIIDHGTTTAEAAGHTGGKRGKGGDLLYRWGNPAAYRSGTKADRRFFGQHDAQWIAKGSPGEGHALVFNNGGERPGGNYSSVDEVVLPVDERGDYTRAAGQPFGPRELSWSYSAPKKDEFFAFIMSGANRLPNGNTLICESVAGLVFEVTPKGETVWKYVNPAGGAFPGMPGGPGFGGPPTLADALPPMFQFMLNFTTEQRSKFDAIQKELVAKLETVLDAAQRKQLLDRRAADPMGFAGMAAPGQIMPLATQVVLKLSADQKAALSALQKEVDTQIDALLDEDQKDRMKQVREMIARGGPPGFRPGGPPPGPGGPPPGFGGPPPGIGGPPGPGGGPPGPGFPPIPPGGMGNAVFRAYRYAKDYPGLAGKELTPGKTIEELEEAKKKEGKGS